MEVAHHNGPAAPLSPSRECPGQLYRRVVYDSCVTYLDFVKQGCKASDADQYFQSLGSILDGALPPELDG